MSPEKPSVPDPKVLAPEEMRKLLPALDQPGTRAPTLSGRVGIAILQELKHYREEQSKLYDHTLTVCGEKGVFFHGQLPGSVYFVPLFCIMWIGQHRLDEKKYSDSAWDIRNNKAQIGELEGAHCRPDLDRFCTDLALCLKSATKLEKVTI
jgi:hypothetical protein